MTGFTVTVGLEHLLPAYLSEMAQDSIRLTELADGPLSELAHHAHGMGGKCAMIGDLTLAHLLYEVERVALLGQADQVAEVLTQAHSLLTHRHP